MTSSPENELPRSPFSQPCYTLRLNRDSAAILLRLLHEEHSALIRWRVCPAQSPLSEEDRRLSLFEVSAMIAMVESTLILTDEILSLPLDDFE